MLVCRSVQNCHPERSGPFFISARFSGRWAAESRDLSACFKRDVLLIRAAAFQISTVLLGVERSNGFRGRGFSRDITHSAAWGFSP